MAQPESKARFSTEHYRKPVRCSEFCSTAWHAELPNGQHAKKRKFFLKRSSAGTIVSQNAVPDDCCARWLASGKVKWKPYFHKWYC